MEPTPGGLSDSHQRRLLANAQYADRLLSDIEEILNAGESKSPFPKYRPDVSLQQARQIRSYISTFRGHLSRVLDAVGVRREFSRFGALHSIKVTLAFVRVAVQEMSPEYLGGYGDLPSEIAAEVRGMCTELEGLINSMERDLALGESADLAARLDRLAKTPGEAGLIRLLDRITSGHGLAEFRAPLADLVERLESPRFEVAVFGRVSSGKSSLLNRLLGTSILPVGVNPVTATPTRIVYGLEPSLTVDFVDRRGQRHPVEDLVEYASEERNPGNALCVTRLLVSLPSPRLREGLVLVDTPGVGALAAAGAAETLAYLPQCDLGIVLVSAANPINQEDLDTLEALARGAIPAMVLLSKADLLSNGDRRKAAEYASRQISSHLGLDIQVHPVSSVRQEDASLEEWFQRELAPLLDRQHELARESVRRKAGSLREAVSAALRAKLGTAGKSASRQVLEQAERSLRTAAGRIEEVRRLCLSKTDAMRLLPQTAAAQAIASWNGHRHSEANEPSATLIRAAAESAASHASADLAQHLLDLAARLQEALSLAEKVLPDNQPPTSESLEKCVREIPRFELALAEIPLQPPWYCLTPAIGRAWLARRLLASAGPRLESAFTVYSRTLAAWSSEVLAELQRRFDERAGVYRAQLGRLSAHGETPPEELERARTDLVELDNWTGNHSNGSSRLDRTS